MSAESPTESISLVAFLPVPPSRVFHAWIDGAAHAAMTGADATSDPHVGGRFTAWDGYIEGTHLALEPDTRIVQAWRTSEFPVDAEDSQLELTLAARDGGCEITLVHSNIPAGQGARYAQGWDDFYFTPMLAAFTATPEPS